MSHGRSSISSNDNGELKACMQALSQVTPQPAGSQPASSSSSI